ncbi:serine/threonine-protein kinase H2 isoform X2 [Physeter macrocephalus]|uniref:Serine/threonine-protein kinase H2 isoform X2 n=1 Tax=Physeter macrocephalus TaxID=9755 RepID=A0A455C4K9_PHYMC|nr:serine/threonine-protein kinase H2 isoform X2 [Physeter catodon]|eukprot:XP_028356265.1 serine/threonine-protein kinase H2 isoform X2 [Physeter catodon]
MRSNENMEELQKLYAIKALIRTGSFSKFVRVEQKTTKKPFAIKVMETRMREGREACLESRKSMIEMPARYCRLLEGWDSVIFFDPSPI